MATTKHRVPGKQTVYYFPSFVSEDEETFLLRKISESPLPKWKSLVRRRLLQVLGGEITPNGALIPQDLPDFVTSYPPLIGRIQALGLFEASKHGKPNHIIVNEYLPGQGIMPHQDGPVYHPVVATISLGSHAVFHYHSFEDSSTPDAPPDSGEPADPSAVSPQSMSGKAAALPQIGSIGQIPILSLFLEPRSLVVTTGEMYTDHLHSLEPVIEDIFLPGGQVIYGRSTGNPLNVSEVEIANKDLVATEAYKQALQEGGSLTRGTRVSMTCRDVERVSKFMHKSI
ncbi:hypothetical protein SISSUDRAFT_989879 [Sistotremastrum suecicum HHB10207 ss-3]|uniref:Fe2OG dioxygenase domain-containing protein n=1 Tax=Sistotremastrum suecicum HHB10207 ss-3 TaxID=1314776 RepID=A0A166B2X4_9AGAM|nr:hypothetical protein SISSUDRAFT_989879 [Sistotremastrum suecicum HHB10207 ss-3]